MTKLTDDIEKPIAYQEVVFTFMALPPLVEVQHAPGARRAAVNP